MQIINMIGMSKSGNHAVIRWILGHFQTSKISTHFYNNTTQRFLEHLNFIFPDLEKKSDRLLMVSYEDVLLNDKFADLANKVSTHNVLLVRDPLNLFASRFEGLGANRGKVEKNYKELSECLPDQINKYLNNYCEFSRKTSLLKNIIPICYNYWSKDQEYRRKIIEDNFKLKFRDCKFNVKAGSSFKRLGVSSDSKDYFTRWKLYSDDSIYKEKILENETLRSISREFGVEI